jgi:hypothetical protein
VLNYIWLALVVLAVGIGGWNNRLGEVTAGAFDGAKTAVLRKHGNNVLCRGGLLRIGRGKANTARDSRRVAGRPGRDHRLGHHLPAVL